MASIRKEAIVSACGYSKISVRAELYDCAKDVVRDCQTRPIRIKEYAMEQKRIHDDWHGVNSYQEALDLMSNGYQPVVERLREELKVNANIGNPRFMFSNEVQGFLPVVPLAIKGIPQSMIDLRIRPLKAKVLDIYYDITANSDKDPEDFIKAGQVLLGTVLALERQGYKFNLYAVQSYQGTCGRERTVDFLCAKIKSSNSPFDLKRMSFPLAHPAYFRVIGFDWESKSPIARDIGHGRGRAITYDFNPDDVNKIVRSVFGNNAIFLSAATLIDDEYDKERLKGVLTSAKCA